MDITWWKAQPLGAVAISNSTLAYMMVESFLGWWALNEAYGHSHSYLTLRVKVCLYKPQCYFKIILSSFQVSVGINKA